MKRGMPRPPGFAGATTDEAARVQVLVDEEGGLLHGSIHLIDGLELALAEDVVVWRVLVGLPQRALPQAAGALWVLRAVGPALAHGCMGRDS